MARRNGSYACALSIFSGFVTVAVVEMSGWSAVADRGYNTADTDRRNRLDLSGVTKPESHWTSSSG
jgi:hypothetical protein